MNLLNYNISKTIKLYILFINIIINHKLFYNIFNIITLLFKHFQEILIHQIRL
jgi:hypothetical protein